MPVNALTTEVGLRVGPVVVETLIKHYFDRLKKETDREEPITRLRRDELLYDEVFNVVKAFLRASSFHTVEDVQGFANTRTPSPPWVHVVRLAVPMSSCDEAATYLVKAFGGEDAARRVVGGVKWWQFRGVNGVDAQWITAKKDWQEAKRRHKMQEKQKGKKNIPSDASASAADTGAYERDMDEMRCILYSHGGGYYFGSVDQERYSIQRHARKINGRVFAINYRLAPQYPFPCALQDLLAAYLFLIRPPPGAAHRPVNPLHIVIAGDSAGGGISLALLQIIRDSGLPMPAGGVLISPWCDLTHSFPSVFTNTTTDVIPPWGLSLQKPSALWPPPSDEVSNRIHASLRSRIRQAFRAEPYEYPTTTIPPDPQPSTPPEMVIDVGATTPPPKSDTLNTQTISITARSGEVLTIDQQVHLYTLNSLLPHPLISPVLSYLGGLPPLLIIASDKEVLRDEIIYTAHKAANPDKYPIKDEIRALYPPLDGIERRCNQPTKVHLQVYDDTAHVLPVLFSFTTPAKFCFRAIATFCKHVTGMHTIPSSPTDTSIPSPNISPGFLFYGRDSLTGQSATHPEVGIVAPECKQDSHSTSPSQPQPRKSLRRSLSSRISRMARHRSTSGTRSECGLDSPTHEPAPPLPNGGPLCENSNTSSDVGGPRFRNTSLPLAFTQERTAGDPSVYDDTWKSSQDKPIIRERISTQGVVRSLEPESELDAFQVPPETIGLLSELSVRRYLDARAKFDKKFATTIKTIEKNRRHNLETASKDTKWSKGVLQSLTQGRKGSDNDHDKEGPVASLGSQNWAWALDGEEKPPPSSIVSRRDTAEARQLARVADQSVPQDDQSLSGNNFWSVVVNFLTVTPDRDNKTGVHIAKKQTSRISRLFTKQASAEQEFT